MLELTKKDQPFNQRKGQEDAFKELKKRFTLELILVIADLDKPKVVKTDVLDKAIKACLNQLDDDRKLYLIAYYLRKMTAPELNYNVYNKELLAIVKAFKQ